jgi:hypothetical protein
MSKDRQMIKDKKKPAAPGGKKAQSDYQAGKSSSSQLDITPGKKK